MKLLRRLFPFALLFLAACASAPPSSDAPDARPSLGHYNVARSTLALEGYDPVSYFAEGGGEPVRGVKAHALESRGVRYRFASEANLELFRRNPARYEPAYGGWCAYAMADGEKVEVDVTSYLIQDGALLLFYDGLFGDTRAAWLDEGPDDLKRRAERGWASISGEAP